ncbi:MAG: FkbM family methyltransferase [Synergistaceae bacterium]|jgi:hypothetical protein|nr:FkbM family methyltransferase [Synergistaceae bacterium]
MRNFLRRLRLFRDLLGKMYSFYSSVEQRNSSPLWERELNRRLNSDLCLERYGFKVYCQNDEDGIIHEIFNRIGTTNKVFIEFGVQNGLESNTHFLLHMGWHGLWIEGSEEFYRGIREKFAAPLKSGQLKAVNKFITRDNINSIFTENGFSGEIDLLSVDIDGNDYHVFEAITAVSPRAVVIEYNAKFPPFCAWVMPYDAAHVWDLSDKQGASLKALELLGRKKGYRLVGTSMSGVNAFFVRDDLAGDLFASPATAENLYNAGRPFGRGSGHPSRAFLENGI